MGRGGDDVIPFETGAGRFVNKMFRKRISGRFVNGALLPARAKALHVNPTRVENEHLKVFP